MKNKREDVSSLTRAPSTPTEPVRRIRPSQLPAASPYLSLNLRRTVLTLRLQPPSTVQQQRRMNNVSSLTPSTVGLCIFPMLLDAYFPIRLQLAFCFYLAFTYLLTIFDVCR